ncbi:MAG: hypothetical protein MJZ24_08760 [Paludibacteraceae bacterium]|nr:hypothetical protein [Paludibacteraceae bacterium]
MMRLFFIYFSFERFIRPLTTIFHSQFKAICQIILCHDLSKVGLTNRYAYRISMRQHQVDLMEYAFFCALGFNAFA